MSRALKLNPRDSSALEAEAMVYLKAEIAEFVAISASLVKSFGFLQSRVKSKFPKDCRKCETVYNSFEEFFYGTDEIAQGTVNYPTLGNDFYLHRNCKSPCESTLVVVFNDRRDDSPLGCRRREVFQESLDKIMLRERMEEFEARDFLLDLLARTMKDDVERLTKEQASAR